MLLDKIVILLSAVNIVESKQQMTLRKVNTTFKVSIYTPSHFFPVNFFASALQNGQTAAFSPEAPKHDWLLDGGA